MKGRTSIRAWQDRIRDPSLTLLLILELCAIFLAAPLAAKGLPIARVVGQTLAFVALVIVVLLSYNRDAIVAILLGVAAIAASALFGAGWLPIVRSALHHMLPLFDLVAAKPAQCSLRYMPNCRKCRGNGCI